LEGLVSISEADLDVFMNDIAQLFLPWFSSPKKDKILRTDEAGNPLYWEMDVQVPEVPLPLKASILRNSLVLLGPATMISTKSKPGWSPVPSDLAPVGFEASVALPAGSDPDLVNTAVIGIPAVIKVEIPVGTARVPVHGLAGRGGGGSTA
jgi:hypothetical protein